MIENEAIIAANAPAPNVGSKPKLGKVLTNSDPACTTPKARKQLLLMREAMAIVLPAVSDFNASSTKSLNDDGTSQSDDSCKLMATSARSRPEMRLYIYMPMICVV